MWVETVTEGGRRFMAAWRKGVDAARHLQEKREANEARKLAIVRGSLEPAKREKLTYSNPVLVRARNGPRPA